MTPKFRNRPYSYKIIASVSSTRGPLTINGYPLFMDKFHQNVSGLRNRAEDVFRIARKAFEESVGRVRSVHTAPVPRDTDPFKGACLVGSRRNRLVSSLNLREKLSFCVRNSRRRVCEFEKVGKANFSRFDGSQTLNVVIYHVQPICHPLRNVIGNMKFSVIIMQLYKPIWL